MSTDPTIIYTLTDEAPALATVAFLPIIRAFAKPAGIRVDTSDVGVLDFDLSDQEKAAAYDDGYRAAEEFLSTWDWARYVAEFR